MNLELPVTQNVVVYGHDCVEDVKWKDNRLKLVMSEKHYYK